MTERKCATIYQIIYTDELSLATAEAFNKKEFNFGPTGILKRCVTPFAFGEDQCFFKYIIHGIC